MDSVVDIVIILLVFAFLQISPSQLLINRKTYIIKNSKSEIIKSDRVCYVEFTYLELGGVERRRRAEATVRSRGDGKEDVEAMWLKVGGDCLNV